MEPNYHYYYDKIYAAKDYSGEVETLLATAGKLMGKVPASVLDVGCGTGTHALCFADQGCEEVVGVDLDESAIKVADEKRKSGPRFFCCDISDIQQHNFDMAVSLFNVINYIEDREAMVLFFCEIAARLKGDGIYIFDCWNGVAALLDPPQHKLTTCTVDGETITVDTNPTMDALNQSVVVDNAVTVTDGNGNIKRFDYQYTSRLWTPRDIEEALTEAGLDLISVTRAMAPDDPADESTWKIMFICRNTLKHMSIAVAKEAA